MEEKIIKIGSNDLIIRKANENDKEKIINFLNFLFKHKKYHLKWLEWLEEIEEYKRDYYIACEKETKEIVGIYGLSPVKVKIKSNYFWTSQCCNIGINPKYWGTELFKEISTFSLENDEGKGRIFAFCSPRRVLAIRSHLNFGWKEVGKLLFYERNINKKEIKNEPKKIPFFQESYDKIIKSFLEKKDFALVKDSNYLNWRYKDNIYEFFTYDFNSFFILKNYSNEDKEIYRRHLIEYFYLNKEDIELAFDYFSSNLKEKQVLHTWVFEGSPSQILLEKNGFKFNGENCSFLIYPYKETIFNSILECNDIHFALGDDEAF